MELVHLRTFLAVLEHRGFRPAARKLYLSQSAVSRQIAECERALGVRLISREPDHIEATDAGVRFAECAQELLDDYQRAVAITHGTLPPCNELVIGLAPGAAGELTVPLLRHLVRVLPQTRIRAWSFDLMTWPDTPPEGCDLLVVHDPFCTARLRSTTLVEEQLCLAVPDRLSEASSVELSMAAALDVPLARPSPSVGRQLRDFWMLHNERNGVEPEVRGDCFSSTSGIAEALERGLAATLSTPLLLRLHGHRGMATIKITGAPRDRLALVSRIEDRREIIDVVHRETAWLVRRVGPLVLPELAEAPWVWQSGDQ